MSNLTTKAPATVAAASTSEPQPPHRKRPLEFNDHQHRAKRLKPCKHSGSSVRFSDAAPVVFRYEDDYDRSSYPPNIFNCDICERQLEGGLRGFEVYLSCWVCEEFDCCLDCAGLEQGGITCTVIRHYDGLHPFIRVDRNQDPSTSEAECCEAEKIANRIRSSNELSPFGYEL